MALPAVNQIACTPEPQKVISLDRQSLQQTYLLLWDTHALKDTAPDTPDSMRCLGGSGTSTYGLTKIISTEEGGLIVSDINLFERLDEVNNVNWQISTEHQPNAVNTRLIVSIDAIDKEHIKVIADKYGDDSRGQSSPSQRWAYVISVPSMKVLRAQLICKLNYDTDANGGVCR